MGYWLAVKLPASVQRSCKRRAVLISGTGASLLITDGKGGEIPIPENVRLYLFASIQHGGGAVAAKFPFNHYPANPAEYGAVHRALVVALDQRVSAAVPPPPSHFPRIRDGRFVIASPENYGFPAIPGVIYPGLVNELSVMDYSTQPPRPIEGREYLIHVPKVDDIAGVRVPDIRVPRGTHTGWNLRRHGFGEGELLLLGSYFPFAATEQERVAAGDPRPSLEERYPTRDHYVKAIARAVEELQNKRLLPAEDADLIAKAASERVDK